MVSLELVDTMSLTTAGYPVRATRYLLLHFLFPFCFLLRLFFSPAPLLCYAVPSAWYECGAAGIHGAASIHVRKRQLPTFAYASVFARSAIDKPSIHTIHNTTQAISIKRRSSSRHIPVMTHRYHQ